MNSKTENISSGKRRGLQSDNLLFHAPSLGLIGEQSHTDRDRQQPQEP